MKLTLCPTTTIDINRLYTTTLWICLRASLLPPQHWLPPPALVANVGSFGLLVQMTATAMEVALLKRKTDEISEATAKLLLVNWPNLSAARSFSYSMLRHKNHRAKGQESQSPSKTCWRWELGKFEVALHASDAKSYTKHQQIWGWQTQNLRPNCKLHQICWNSEPPSINELDTAFLLKKKKWVPT